MKTLFFILAFFFVQQSFAQTVDSSTLFVKPVPIQYGDVKMLMRLCRSDVDTYEDFTQMVRSKVTKATTNTTVINFDSVQVKVLAGFYDYSQRVPNGYAKGWATRIETLLKSTLASDAVVVYLRKLLQAIDDTFANAVQADKQFGDFISTKKINAP